MSKFNRFQWSNSTIKVIENYIKKLMIEMPILTKCLKHNYSYNTTKGSDIKLELIDRNGDKNYLLIEVEQYASGQLLNKVKKWADRHLKNPKTTTTVISLVLNALHKRLINEFYPSYPKIDALIYSPNFRLFPGTGNGTIPFEVKGFIKSWITQKI